MRPPKGWDHTGPTQELWPRVLHESEEYLTGLVTHIPEICLYSQESFISVPHSPSWLFFCPLGGSAVAVSNAEWTISAKTLSFQLLPWPQPSACPSLTSPLDPHWHLQNKELPERLWLPDLVTLCLHVSSWKLSGKQNTLPSHIHSFLLLGGLATPDLLC